ncbi:MAG: O-antigen ligase family protein, partial [Acidobacteriota bacterium]
LLFIALQPYLDKMIMISMGQGLPDLSMGRLGLAFLLISLLGRATLGKVRLAPLGLMELLTVAVPVGIMLAAPLSKQPLSVVQTAFSHYLLPLLIYFIAKNCVHDEHELTSLMTAVMVLGVLVTAYMVFELATGVILFPEDGASAERLARTYSRRTPGLWLVKGLLSDSYNFGRVLVTTILASTYLLFRRRGREWSWWILAALIFQLTGLFLSLNRTCWVALVVGLAILQFAFPRLRRWLLTTVIVVAATVVVFHRPVLESVLVQKRVLYNLRTLNGRLPRWHTAIDMWRDRPVLGWGFGRFEDHSGLYRRDGGVDNLKTPESDYLTILVSAGLVGFLPYVLSLLTPFFFSLRLFYKARAPDWGGFVRPEAIITYWAVLSGLLLTSLTVNLGLGIVRGLVYTVAGAVVGTHEVWLRAANRTAPRFVDRGDTGEPTLRPDRADPPRLDGR